ncbi:MAG: hypothetical protein JOY59_10425 [Candidatus Eremiobacteraeota bacterium]|nr:hypothetical protein [Candidatus Eremiobacteraeota bacterium]
MPSDLSGIVGWSMFGLCVVTFAACGIPLTRIVLSAIALRKRLDDLIPNELGARLDRLPNDLERIRAAAAALPLLGERAQNAVASLEHSLRPILVAWSFLRRARRLLS